MNDGGQSKTVQGVIYSYVSAWRVVDTCVPRNNCVESNFGCGSSNADRVIDCSPLSATLLSKRHVDDKINTKLLHACLWSLLWKVFNINSLKFTPYPISPDRQTMQIYMLHLLGQSWSLIDYRCFACSLVITTFLIENCTASTRTAFHSIILIHKSVLLARH